MGQGVRVKGYQKLVLLNRKNTAMGWFSKNKKPPRRPRMEMVQDYLPQAKPFTKALILRASQYSDESYDELKKMAGKVNYEDNDKTFEDFVASSALTISNKITSQAAKSIGIETNYIPGFDIPKEAPYIVGFSVCILHLINEFLLGDEVTINLKFATIDTAKLHFMLHDNQEASEQALKGIKIFEEVQANRSKAVNDWRDGLSKLISIYVLQWTSDNDEFKKLECISLFGKHLQILINVGLYGVATADKKC
jgi:hypothetical protein